MTNSFDYGLRTILLATLIVSGCGIKPSRLDQPEGTAKNDFPRQYPMPDGSFDDKKK